MFILLLDMMKYPFWLGKGMAKKRHWWISQFVEDHHNWYRGSIRNWTWCSMGFSWFSRPLWGGIKYFCVGIKYTVIFTDRSVENWEVSGYCWYVDMRVFENAVPPNPFGIIVTSYMTHGDWSKPTSYVGAHQLSRVPWCPMPSWQTNRDAQVSWSCCPTIQHG